MLISAQSYIILNLPILKKFTCPIGDASHCMSRLKRRWNALEKVCAELKLKLMPWNSLTE